MEYNVMIWIWFDSVGLLGIQIREYKTTKL